MRFLKLVIISVIVLFVIITAISSLLPSKVLVSRAVDIHSSKQKVEAQLVNLPNWRNWMTDAKGQRGEHVYNAKTNTLSIGPTRVKISSVTDSTIQTTWAASAGMTGTFRIIDHHNIDSVITVQWQMEQEVKWYPWQKFASITKDELWGASMEKSLDNLKALLEGQ